MLGFCYSGDSGSCTEALKADHKTRERIASIGGVGCDAVGIAGVSGALK